MWADLLWQKQQVIVEYDSDAFHSDLGESPSRFRSASSSRKCRLPRHQHHTKPPRLHRRDEPGRSDDCPSAQASPALPRARLRAAPNTTLDNPGSRRSVKQSMTRLRAQARAQERPRGLLPSRGGTLARGEQSATKSQVWYREEGRRCRNRSQHSQDRRFGTEPRRSVGKIGGLRYRDVRKFWRNRAIWYLLVAKSQV